ncbi:hypothetical protein [Phormidium sp. CCY1219]|uniref:hypothetical protein n=1 Tax=Phormidium sp. CCY1219 TaxID=2886104 RepID=UPI002D1F167E|nr:hypothetical protein [Phormidium sp. CCY1219]MEB3829710.1 hypothetical protein [Phormidium sp. CCY1219]
MKPAAIAAPDPNRRFLPLCGETPMSVRWLSPPHQTTKAPPRGDRLPLVSSSMTHKYWFFNHVTYASEFLA